MTTRAEFKTELAELVRQLIPTIGDDYRAAPDDRSSDDTPSMAITIGADEKGWSHQTGDNSFTGGAYGYAYWGVGTIDRDSDPVDVAEDLLRSLKDATDSDVRLFFDPPRMHCDECEMLSINGVPCHETGCPNSGARWDAETGDWIKQRTCRECGCTVDADDPCCSAEQE
jgi:hypothetical protein